MGTQEGVYRVCSTTLEGKHGCTGYIGVYSITRVFKGIQDMHGYTGYIGVYKVYSTTRVNMGTQDI